MNNLESMLERNKDFAAQQSAAGTLMPWLPSALPNVKAVIIGCADMRVDPVHVLGIKPGEAVVMRNIGGRITPGLLEQMGLLGRIGQVAGGVPGGGKEFHLIVLHHRLRHHSSCRRPCYAGAVFSDRGRKSRSKSGARSARGSCRRCCLAQDDFSIAGQVACLRPRL